MTGATWACLSTLGQCAAATDDFSLPCTGVPNDAILGRADLEFFFEAWEYLDGDVASLANDSDNVVPELVLTADVPEDVKTGRGTDIFARIL